ncbi:MAG TPA: hypothetical protein VGM63_22050 [Mucilaginibacter sp.]|jgi:hypothetical protein
MISENEKVEENKHKDQPQNTVRPNAYRVEDADNLEEEDLKRSYLFGSAKMKSTEEPGMEGQGMGGQNFDRNNLIPAGNDKANPPQNAGEGNAYFRRTQPAEEHPEDENFVAQSQEGEPGKKEEPNIPGPQELPDQQKVGEDTKENKNGPNPQQNYQEGTVDSDD